MRSCILPKNKAFNVSKTSQIPPIRIIHLELIAVVNIASRLLKYLQTPHDEELSAS